MNTEEAKKLIALTLQQVAPEIKSDELDYESTFRSQVDLDSYDFYNFLSRLEKTTGVKISESEIREIKTLSQLVVFISKKSH